MWITKWERHRRHTCITAMLLCTEHTDAIFSSVLFPGAEHIVVVWYSFDGRREKNYTTRMSHMWVYNFAVFFFSFWCTCGGGEILFSHSIITSTFPSSFFLTLIIKSSKKKGRLIIDYCWPVSGEVKMISDRCCHCIYWILTVVVYLFLTMIFVLLQSIYRSHTNGRMSHPSIHILIFNFVLFHWKMCETVCC